MLYFFMKLCLSVLLHVFWYGVKHILPQAGRAVSCANWDWIGYVVHWAIQAGCWREEGSVEEGLVETGYLVTMGAVET